MRIVNVNRIITHSTYRITFKNKLPQTPIKIPRYNKVKQAELASFIVLLIIELNCRQSKSRRTNVGKSSSACHDHRCCSS